MTKHDIVALIFFMFLFYESKAQLHTQTDLFVGAETTVFTDFDIEASSTGSIDNNGTVILEGNFTNDGLVSSTVASKLVFQGTRDVTFTAEGNTTSDYGTVEMAKTSADVTMESDGTIKGTLNFTGEDTKLILDENTVTLTTSATSTGYDDNEYVQADGDGFLGKDLSTAGSFFYPVGDVDDYSPINSTVSGTLGTNPNVKVNVRDVKHPNMLTDATAYLTRYWNVEATDITGYSNSLAGTYISGASDVVGTEADIDGSSHNATDWTFTDGAINTAQRTVLGSTTDMSVDFTGQYSPTALPLVLTSFVAVRTEQNDVNLDWTTISEVNVSHFILERSYDAVRWEDVASIVANNTVEQNEYDHTDYYSNQTQKFGTVYYRLRSVDFDGTYAYSTIREVILSAQDMRVVSGVLADHIDVYTGTQVVMDIRLFDLSGRMIQSVRTANDYVRIDNIPKGYYILTLSNANGVILHNTKIVKL